MISLLNQTFQNFEVIIVDDCSTDNSCAVVESFMPKFGGRLKLYRSKVNSGPAIPSNRGVNLSCGKYLFIMDSDDLIVNNALETFYRYAENASADVVHIDVGYKFRRNSQKPFPAQEDVEIVGWHGGPFVNKPTLESDDIAARMLKISRNGVGWTAWQKFVRRDFILENEIVFPKMRTSQDIVWVVQVFSLAKKILTIPEPLYIHRNNPTSNTGRKRTKEEFIHYRMDNSAEGMKFLLNFFDKHKFFKENPQCQWWVMNFWAGVHSMRDLVVDTPIYEVYQTVQDTFKQRFGECGNLIAYLCYSSALLQHNWRTAEQRIMQLENHLKELQKPN